MIIGILEPDSFSDNALLALKSVGKIELLKKNNLKLFVEDKEILFVRLKYKIDKELIDAASNLKIICSPTTGLNHIDTKYCEERKIRIISLKGEIAFLKTIKATAEHTLGLILALKRNYKSAFLNSNNCIWDRDQYRGYEINQCKIGIIGLGRVGIILSRYLMNMGAKVGYYDIKKKNVSSKLIKYKSISALISETDVIVLCSSFDIEVGSILNRNEIDSMKNKYFVNTARAELTDEKYLVKKALLGHFAGVAIDVIQEEQTKKTNLDLWMKAVSNNNVIVTPHIAGATYTSMNKTEEFITHKLIKSHDIKESLDYS